MKMFALCVEILLIFITTTSVATLSRWFEGTTLIQNEHVFIKSSGHITALHYKGAWNLFVDNNPLEKYRELIRLPLSFECAERINHTLDVSIPPESKCNFSKSIDVPLSKSMPVFVTVDYPNERSIKQIYLIFNISTSKVCCFFLVFRSCLCFYFCRQFSSKQTRP